MAVKSQGGSSQNDIGIFIEKMHDIRTEEHSARAKRLADKNQVGKAVSSKTSGKQIGYSFKSGQHDAINNKSKYDYSSMDGVGVIKTGKKKK